MNKTLKDILKEQVGKIVSLPSSSGTREWQGIREKICGKDLSNRLNEQSLSNSQLWSTFPGCACAATEYRPGIIYSGGPMFIEGILTNPDGSLPLYNPSTLNGISEQDLSLASKIIAENYSAHIGSEAEKARCRLEKINKVIAKYTSGCKPTYMDLVGGRSFSEPFLQLGTPNEGLTESFIGNVFLKPLEVTDKSNSPFADLVEDEGENFQILFGNYENMKQGRALLKKYLTFISDNLIKDPTIRPITSRSIKGSDTERVNAVSRYIDIEWQRKDEAIAMAQELKGLYERQINWLKSLGKTK